MVNLQYMKERVFNNVIRDLMRNDSNGTWDEIMEDCDNDIDKAHALLIECLLITIEEFSEECEEVMFYKEQLERLNLI